MRFGRNKTFKYRVPGRAETRGGSIKWRIFSYFVLFAFIMLVLLWLVETVFLDAFYKASKTRDMERVSSQISQTLQEEGFGSGALSDVLDTVAQNNYMCVQVARLSSYDGHNLLAQRVHVAPLCLIHELTADELVRLAAVVEEAGGKQEFELDFSREETGPRSLLAEILGERFHKLTRLYRQNYDVPTMLVSARVVEVRGELRRDEMMLSMLRYFTLSLQEDLSLEVSLTEAAGEVERYLVLVNGNVNPLDATVNTLRMQLVLITGVMVLLGLVLALLISEQIGRPIIHINKLSRRLALGDFELDFSVPGADREIAELAASLNYAAVELAKTEQLERDLIANISHDLRTPLTLITAYGEAMRDLPGENTPENVQVIIDETQRLSVLVSDLLDISKLQAGAIELEPEEFELTGLVQEIILRFNKLMATEGYEIRFEPGCRLTVEADKIKLTQVIYNLINNAITYTGEDKLVIIRQMLLHHDARVRIEVEDTGEGIAPEQIADIWRRYYKGSANHQRTQAGNGLGLAIVKNILDLHGGAYGVESTPGKGSLFWFELEVRAKDRL